ncbi:MAG: GHMP kinase, partial [Proteobacteria bacterium]|nr:GHMP kinase [Pseudomonadota bacterium]
MIVTQTPYRVSFAGGGTDLPAFYEKEFGAVLSAAVDLHMYITVSPRFDSTIRVSYTQTEITDGIDGIKHEIVREALRLTDLSEHIEITTIGDVPAGTGMGSSSSLTVGLLHALYAFRGDIVSTSRIADEACRIEIEILGKPIGKQDQYAAAYGGLNYIRFNPSGTVEVEPVPARQETLRQIEDWTLIFYTQQQRNADTILQKQTDGTADKMSVLRQMRDLASEMRGPLTGGGDLNEFGRLLHEGWELKRSLGFGITTTDVDEWYQNARKAGALGGKLLGAGGGGFLLVFAPPDRHDDIRKALGAPKEV